LMLQLRWFAATPQHSRHGRGSIQKAGCRMSNSSWHSRVVFQVFLARRRQPAHHKQATILLPRCSGLPHTSTHSPDTTKQQHATGPSVQQT
jgi:hypothetical protein